MSDLIDRQAAVIAAALHEMEQSEREFEKGGSDAEV